MSRWLIGCLIGLWSVAATGQVADADCFSGACGGSSGIPVQLLPRDNNASFGSQTNELCALRKSTTYYKQFSFFYQL